MSWHPSRSLGDVESGISRASLAAVASDNQRLDVFAVDNPERNLFGPRTLMWWHLDGDLRTLATALPQTCGGRLRDITPSAVSRARGRVDVFAVGADDQDGRLITWWRHAGGDAGGPEVLGGTNGLLSNAGLSAVSWGESRLDVFGVSNPHPTFLGPRTLQHWFWDGRGWNGPQDISNGRLRDVTPSAVCRDVGVIDVFAVGADDEDGMIIAWWFPEPSTATRFGNHFLLPGQSRGMIGNGGPTAVTANRDRLDVFAVGANGNLLHWLWTPGTNWQGPEIVARDIAFASDGRVGVAMARDATGAMTGPMRVCARTTSGDVASWHYDLRWFAPNGRTAGALGPVGTTIVAPFSGQEPFVAAGTPYGRPAYNIETDASYSPPAVPSLRVRQIGPATVRVAWDAIATSAISYDLYEHVGALFGDDAHRGGPYAVNAGAVDLSVNPLGNHCFYLIAQDAEYGTATGQQTCIVLTSAPVAHPGLTITIGHDSVITEVLQASGFVDEGSASQNWSISAGQTSTQVHPSASGAPGSTWTIRGTVQFRYREPDPSSSSYGMIETTQIPFLLDFSSIATNVIVSIGYDISTHMFVAMRS